MPTKVLVAIIVGFLLAGVGTKITYDCAPVDDAAGCVSIDRALMHPNDLLNNKQDSLLRFSEIFSVTALGMYITLVIFQFVYKKSKLKTVRNLTASD